MSDDENETAWNFNDFFEFAEQDNLVNPKPVSEKEQLASKISFYPSNSRSTAPKIQQQFSNK